MSDLDIQLIREFALRPIIYNKATPFFKNKYLTDCAWDEIASKVGVGDVNRVRDRINQLRNRYNLEKRKVDLQRTDGVLSARSTWPLFNHFRFLDGHIRPRKSYKALGRRPRPVGRPRRNPYTDDSYTMFNDAVQYANPLAVQHQNTRIKTEPGLNHTSDTNASHTFNSEYESENDGDGEANYTEHNSRSDQKSTSDGENFINPASFLVENEDSNGEQTSKHNDVGRESNSSAPRLYSQNVDPAANQPKTKSLNLTIRNLNSISSQNQLIQNGRCNRNSSNSNLPIAVDSESESSVHNQYGYGQNAHENISAAKFEAFGKFISSSLIDLPEHSALQLVEKFTTEIVRTLIQSKNTNEKETQNHVG